MGRWGEGSNKHGEVGRRAVISMGRWEGGQ